MYRQFTASLLVFISGFLISPAWASFSAPQANCEQLYVSGKNALNCRNYKQAECSLKAALVATNGDTSRQCQILDALEELYEVQKNYSAAEKILLLSLDVLRRQDGFPDAHCGVAYEKLAEASLFLGRLKAAEGYALAAVPIIKNNCGPESVDTAVALNNLGWVECAINKQALAKIHFSQALQIIKQAIGEETVLYGTVANNLADSYLKTCDRQAALMWFQRSARALNQSLGSDDSFAQDVAVQCHQLETAADHKRNQAPNALSSHQSIPAHK